ncbi:MAG: hypothetical protein HYV62_09625 [Candidatus Rokubacteria bacterium]|nr:hypothetical protein [Candidatus Rokubacteria bacterium]
MPDPAFGFAVLVGVSAATYSTFLKLGSGAITPALGALIVTGAAGVVNLVVLLGMRAQGQPILFTPRAAAFMVVCGIAAAGIDLFGLLAYGQGLKLSSSLLITGVSTSLVLLVGFLALGEPFTWTRLVAIALIAAGILLLHAQGI